MSGPSTPWYERVPKSKREERLASMSEGPFLKLLRKAAVSHADKEALKQTTLAAALGVKPGFLRDVEAGHRPVTYQIAKIYCDAMGIPVETLKRVGKGKLKWPGDAPDPEPAAAAPAKPKTKTKKSEEEREYQRKLRAENRVLEGADPFVDLSKVKSITVRNQDEECMVMTFKVTPKGNLIIDLHADSSEARPAELLKAGFTGTRVAAPQTLSYDMGREKKVFETSVPVKRED
jgi:hypothetical protein